MDAMKRSEIVTGGLDSGRVLIVELRESASKLTRGLLRVLWTALNGKFEGGKKSSVRFLIDVARRQLISSAQSFRYRNLLAIMSSRYWSGIPMKS